MNQPTLDILVRRLERLERENRYWRVNAVAGLLGLLALILMGQAHPSLRTLEAERVVVKDKAGRLRVALGALDGRLDVPNPLYGLTVYDPNGRRTAQIYDQGTLGGATLSLGGSQSIIWMNAGTDIRVNFEVYEEGRTERDRRLNKALRETLDKKESGWMEYGESERRGVTAASLEVKKGQPSLSLTGNDRELRAVFGATALKAVRTDIEEQRPASSLVLFDKEGKVLWKAP